MGLFIKLSKKVTKALLEYEIGVALPIEGAH